MFKLYKKTSLLYHWMCVWCQCMSFLIKTHSSSFHRGSLCVVLPEEGQSVALGDGAQA